MKRKRRSWRGAIIVKEDCEHIPDWPKPQDEFKMMYNVDRLISLSKIFREHNGEELEEKIKKSRKKILFEAIEFTKLSHPDFKAKYDKEYFGVC